MPSPSNNRNKSQSNNAERLKRRRYKAKAIKARRNSFKGNASQPQSASSIGETMLTNIKPIPATPSSRVNSILNTVFRLMIVGVGIGTIFGSILANLDLTKPWFPFSGFSLSGMGKENSPDSGVLNTNSTNQAKITKEITPVVKDSAKIQFSQELNPLKDKLVNLTAENYSHLEPSVFLLDVDNGNYVNWNGITPFPAASTIKIPILIAFFAEVDEGNVFLDEKLTITESVIGGGSGGMQYKPVGTEYTAIETAREMIVNSDNTATNMIIEQLGGQEKLNQQFREWGLEATVINNPLPDLEGTNTTTARDLVILLAKVNRGQIVSLRSRDRLLAIMEKTRTKTLLPQGLERGANIAHKTGDIKKVLGDAGIIDITTGKRYIAAMLVKRPDNDYTARTLIQEMSSKSYQHFKYYLPHPPLTNNE